MKNIVVPIDFTEISENALIYATAWAKELKTGVTLLHAYHIFPPELTAPDNEENAETGFLRQRAETKLKAICKEVEGTTPCDCHFVNIGGEVTDVITDYIDEVKPDMMVMGTENLHRYNKMLFGTVTGKVIREAECTLLVVPEDATYHPPKKIAFAMDYHDSDMEEINFVTRLANRFKAEVHVVHVVTDDDDLEFEKEFFEDFRKELKQHFPKKDINLRLVEGKKVYRGLEKYVKLEDIDILAVAKTSRNAIERLLTGSVSQKLFYNLNIPLLVFRAKDDLNNFLM